MAQEEVWICANCEETIDKDAEKCPECGFNPNKHAFKAVVYSLLAIPFALSIIGIPVGYILMKLGGKHKDRANMTHPTRLA